MIKIYIPLKDGQALSEEVMQGLIKNNCVPVPITSVGADKYSEGNRNGNLLRAMRQVQENNENYFIFMDSDVILSENIIYELFEDDKNMNKSIITIATDRSRHGLVYMKFGMVNKFERHLKTQDYTERDGHDDCRICEFLNVNQHMMLKNENVTESTRTDNEDLETYLGRKPLELELGKNEINKYFDMAFVINRDEDKEIMERCTARLNKAGIKFERFSALKPQDQENKSPLTADDLDEPIHDMEIGNGHWGALASHSAIVKLAQSRGYKRILIFEDDVIFRNDVQEIFTKQIEQLKTIDWDIFLLGACKIGQTNKVTENIESIDKTTMLHAYALNMNIATKFIDYLDYCNEHRDRFFDEVSIKGLKRFVAKPMTAVQETHFGAANGKFMNQTAIILRKEGEAKEFYDNCNELDYIFKKEDVQI